MNSKIIPVILCGGVGERLWPISRKQYPKQFYNFGSAHSLFQQTLLRVQSAEFERPIIVSNIEHRFLVAQHLHEIDAQADVILEPSNRSTAAAIIAAGIFANAKYGNAILLVLPCDHAIEDLQALHQAVEIAKIAASKGSLVTFGVAPKYPHIGYGYVQKSEELCDGAYKVAQFVEKPDEARAQQYCMSGNFLWNSGMFAFEVASLLREAKLLQPKMYELLVQAVENSTDDADFIKLNKEDFEQIENISFDVAIMEQTNCAAIVPLECGWSDLGEWNEIYNLATKDENGNANYGEVKLLQSNNNYCYSAANAPMISAIGVENLAIISTKDAVLVTSMQYSQQVKELCANLDKNLIIQHYDAPRPWGNYQVLLDRKHDNNNVKVKYVEVAVGERISLQRHQNRSEHWLILSGIGNLMLGNVNQRKLSSGDYIFVDKGEIHSIENIGDELLRFIEVQMGENLSEDDIIRIQDKYGRT